MIKEKIYSFFEEKESKEYKHNTGFSVAPSYITKCKRAIYYQKTNTEKTNPITLQAFVKMEMGNSVHDTIANILRKQFSVDYVQGEELKSIEWNKLKWFYKIDNQLKNPDRIIELKTIYGGGFDYIERSGPKEDHEIQLFLYMEFEKIDSGILVYIGRDNGFILEFVYTLETLRKKYQDKIKKVCHDMLILMANIADKEIPARDFQIVLKNNGVKDTVSMQYDLSEDFQKDKIKYKSEWHCSYCGWKNLCWKSELEEIKKHKFYIAEKFLD